MSTNVSSSRSYSLGNIFRTISRSMSVMQSNKKHTFDAWCWERMLFLSFRNDVGNMWSGNDPRDLNFAEQSRLHSPIPNLNIPIVQMKHTVIPGLCLTSSPLSESLC